jgi:Ca2+:H+ antiporter
MQMMPGQMAVPMPVGAVGSVPPQAPASGCARECQGLAGILCTPLNILLVAVPLGIISPSQEWGCLATFLLNFTAIVPLAGILGGATEALAAHTGQMIGGLLNATFGNAVEMIVTINAIKAGLIRVVQGSLLGSILSNLLLVLGMAFFAAGLKMKESSFNIIGASTNMTCLTLASIALALPTIYSHLPETEFEDMVQISRVSSVVIAVVYLLFLWFQLVTHADIFGGEEEEETEQATMSAGTAVLLLLAATLTVAVCSEYLVDSIEGVSEDYGLPKAFIGVILLPIVGNAAEHATAVTCAAKGKMDLSLGVAVGSSTQIALFVVPFSVIVGWAYDVPMSLDFRIFDSSCLLLSILLAQSILSDGCSNWLEGAMLMATYLLIAIICWYIPSEPEGSQIHPHRHREL